MPKRLRIQCAAGGCTKKFAPRVRTQIYCTQTCKNREAQRRFAKRQQAQAPKSQEAAHV